MKGIAVQNHKRNVRPTHSQPVFLRTGPREECCITGYERLLSARLIHRDLQTELLMGMMSKAHPVTESKCGCVGGEVEPVCMFGWGEGS